MYIRSSPSSQLSPALVECARDNMAGATYFEGRSTGRFGTSLVGARQPDVPSSASRGRLGAGVALARILQYIKRWRLVPRARLRNCAAAAQ